MSAVPSFAGEGRVRRDWFAQRIQILPAILCLAFATTASADPLVWLPQGPAPIWDEPYAYAGAINAVVAHPEDPNVVYVGAVNGGVWKTTNALAGKPHWTPLTDDQKSLSIGALALDPTDGTYQTLVAGIGEKSSFYAGGASIGLLRTTDGGATWTVINDKGIFDDIKVTGVAPRGDVIVASTQRGIFRRSADGQWTKLNGTEGTGLPPGGSFTLASDPSDPARLFADVGNKGIFRSDDTGATWSKVSDAAIDKLFKPSSPSMVRIAVGKGGELYVAIARILKDSDNPKRRAAPRLAGLFRSGDRGATWTALDPPGSVEEGGKMFGIHPGGQADLHFSLVADPTDPNILYIGGDRQPALNEDSNGSNFPNSIGATGWTARLFRVDASKPSGSQSDPLTDSGTASDTTLHPDSRGMAIAANGDLLEVDDGGISRRTNPRTDDGDWYSVNGDIQIAELHSVAWDSVVHVILGGAQDNDTSQQGEENEKKWGSVDFGDGGVVAVDDTSTPGESTRYSSTQYLGGESGKYEHGFIKRWYTSDKENRGWRDIPLRVMDGGEALVPQFYTPVELNKVDATRMIIGGANSVYESVDEGDTVEEIGHGIIVNPDGNPIAYGAAGNPDMLYVGSGNSVYVRKAASPAPLVKGAALPNAGKCVTRKREGCITGLAIDPGDPQIAFAVNQERVYRTTDAGASWTDVTGNLPELEPIVLRSVTYIPDFRGGTVSVGTNTGVFAAFGPDFSVWERLGSALPNAPVFRLQYDAGDNLLLAGTLGRGAWTLDLNEAP